MKVRQWATSVGCTTLGALALLSASSPQALADDAGLAQPIASTHHQPEQRRSANELVRVVREATARYRDVEAAKADGYQLAFGCVTGSDYGAMGLHYVNGDLLGDGKLDPTRPEIVIYEPLPNGRLRLIGADYLVTSMTPGRAFVCLSTNAEFSSRPRGQMSAQLRRRSLVRGQDAAAIADTRSWRVFSRHATSC